MNRNVKEYLIYFMLWRCFSTSRFAMAMQTISAGRVFSLFYLGSDQYSP